MELRHLRYFVTLGETLHFGRAAERLGIAQPPLSQQVRRLEEELGVRLLHRTSRHVNLTDAGRLFLVEARRTLAQAERAASTAMRAHRGEIGRLAIGYMASAELSVFPKILPVFRKRHPGVHIDLQILPPREQFQQLRAGRLHVGFVRLPATDRTLSIVPVFQEPLVAVLPGGHALAEQPAVALHALRDEALVLFPRRHAPGYYDFLMRVCRQSGLDPKVVHESEKLQTIVSLVAMGRGVSLMPRCVANLARKGVVCRPFRPRVPDTELGLVYDPTNRSDLVQAFVGLAKNVLLSRAGRRAEGVAARGDHFAGRAPHGSRAGGRPHRARPLGRA